MTEEHYIFYHFIVKCKEVKMKDKVKSAEVKLENWRAYEVNLGYLHE